MQYVRLAGGKVGRYSVPIPVQYVGASPIPCRGPSQSPLFPPPLKRWMSPLNGSVHHRTYNVLLVLYLPYPSSLTTLYYFHPIAYPGDQFEVCSFPVLSACCGIGVVSSSQSPFHFSQSLALYAAFLFGQGLSPSPRVTRPWPWRILTEEESSI